MQMRPWRCSKATLKSRARQVRSKSRRSTAQPSIWLERIPIHWPIIWSPIPTTSGINSRTNITSSTALSASNSYSPYAYGSSDLNYYGSFYNIPGYGMMWQPYLVGAGWDPFMNGSWVWYPG